MSMGVRTLLDRAISHLTDPRSYADGPKTGHKKTHPHAGGIEDRRGAGLMDGEVRPSLQDEKEG